MRSVIIFLVVFLFAKNHIKGQDCLVSSDSLKGNYTGDCRKGKAHGQGKAAGTHTYEGSFKNGLPDGLGTYFWPDSSRFTGNYSKGIKQGKGTMIYRLPNETDSVVEGYWKGDKYLGEYENAWELVSRSPGVSRVEVQHNPENKNQISLTPADNSSMTGLRIINIQVQRGSYMDAISNSTKLSGVQTILRQVVYPFYATFSISNSHEVTMRFNAPGEYTVTIRTQN
jgi:hypothetical protein